MVEDTPYSISIMDKNGKLLFTGPITDWQVSLGHIQEGSVRFALDKLWDSPVGEKKLDVQTCFKCNKVFAGETHYLCYDCRL